MKAGGCCPERAPRGKMEWESQAAGTSAGWELTPNVGQGSRHSPWCLTDATCKGQAAGNTAALLGESSDGVVHCGMGTRRRGRGTRPACVFQSSPQTGGLPRPLPSLS